MIVIWHINVYTLPHVIDLRCTQAIPHGACPVTRIHMAVLGHLVKMHLAQHFGNQKWDTRSIPKRWIHSRETPGTWRGSYWGSHMQHKYTVQQGTGLNSGTADRALNIEKRNTKAKHPYTETKDRTTAKIALPKAGWDGCLRWKCNSSRAFL